MAHCNSCGRAIPEQSRYCDRCGREVGDSATTAATSPKISTLRLLLGILVLVFAELTIVVGVRDVVFAIRGSAFNVGTAAYEGVLTVILFFLGRFLLGQHLRRKKPRLILGVSSAVMVFWGFMAGTM